MWVWSRIERSAGESRKQMIDEVGLLQAVGLQGKRRVMDLTWKREKNWIGYTLRGESLLREVIEGRMIGKRPRRKKRLGMLNEFLKESSYAELKSKTENRKDWETWKPRTCLMAER